MSYASFLARAIAWGELARQNWPLILAIYQAVVALYEKINQPVPGLEDGTLSLTVATDDELNAEERLSMLIDDGKQSLSLDRFRKVFQVLKALGLLDKLGGLFGSLGS